EPLDMRYDTRMECIHEATDPPLGLDGQPLYGKCTAAELVNTMDTDALEQVFTSYGEEKFSKDIAKAIVEKREEYGLETVEDLVNVVLTVYRVKLHSDKEVPWIGGTHPATQVFQALRIAVNNEFEVLKSGLDQAVRVVQPGGRIAVITFHSLEDIIVKHFFKSKKSEVSIITKKPIITSDEELLKNPRARSAKLRVVQKHT
ncbi:MAG: 16S rRNA (cytosine(1402)-N(4))-methyltransferase RsmH, partial [Candidatus Magasanikbacteria bacterium]